MRIVMATRHDANEAHGDTSRNNGMDRGEESPTAASSGAEEVYVEDLDQDADLNANPHDEDEAASEDEPGLEPTYMQHIIVHTHRTEHKMYNTGKSASLIVKMAFVVPRPRRLDADDVFEGLIQFEEEKRKGKRKTTTAPVRNTKKSRPVEAVPEEPFDPMTNPITEFSCASWGRVPVTGLMGTRPDEEAHGDASR
ncbi:hypothetical protein R1sor_013844 [Riccia sorocarpa]|uniref:Uncharacterized protein n=1 Tax=Riccia sorocarpa TaxID=122646 RepID=A0ABD3HAX9_9MARC